MTKPDPTQRAPSKQPMVATLGPRGRFIGWWALLQQYGVLKTRHSRLIGNQGIPGACQATLRHQMAGLDWRIVTKDGEENDETRYYTLLLENARDALGNVIGGSGLFDLLAQDILTAHEGGNVEIVRIRGGQYDGVPIGLYAMDASTLRWDGHDEERPVAQVSAAGRELARFAHDEVMHVCWSRYADAGMQWYNYHPVQTAWVAINALAAGDDYNYSLLTEVIPQGILNLGPGFTEDMAKEWREAWRQARQGGKLEDIGLLWGTERAEFIRFNEPLKDQPFQHMSYWYLTIVTAAFEMSPLDLGFMTQLNTKAAAEAVTELSRNKGLRHLLRSIKQAVEYWILPEGLALEWPDLDPTDEVYEAQARKTNAEAISTAVMGFWMTPEEARREAQKLGVFDFGEGAKAPPQGGGRRGRGDNGRESGGGRAEKAFPPLGWFERGLVALRRDVARTSRDPRYAGFYTVSGDGLARAAKQGGGEDYPRGVGDEEREALDGAEQKIESGVTRALEPQIERARQVRIQPPADEDLDRWAQAITVNIVRAEDDQALAQGMTEGMEEAVGTGIAWAQRQLGIEIDFDLLNPRVIRFVAEHALAVAQTVNATTEERLRHHLVAGWELGEDMDKLTERVLRVMDEIPTWRALRIARTETIRAFNGGSWMLYGESGVVKTKKWLDGQPGACNICKGVHGEEVPLDEEFSIGVMFPPAHPNCRCAVRAGEVDLSGYKASV
jgi:SPP1 gp7 family putative phage head morphogenesis protein